MAVARAGKKGRLASVSETAPAFARSTPESRSRPVLLVLAGVNGAGKSSIGGDVMLRRAGLTWFDPDRFSDMLAQAGLPLEEANAQAWRHGVELLDQAIANGLSHAFETTLAGQTMAQKIRLATRTHDVLVWYCGLASPEQHVARVLARAAAGGQDIARDRIRQRWVQSPLNLIALLPHVSELRVFDNSAEAAPGCPVADPELLLHLRAGKVEFPLTLRDLELTPQWAKPIMMAVQSLTKSPVKRPGSLSGRRKKSL